MIRKIIKIDEEKCNGCGLCANACKEAAIGIVGGKAKLLREDFCDGLGNCLPACPTGAITFVEREAAAYDEAAVKAKQAKEAQAKEEAPKPAPHFGCPGTRSRSIERTEHPAAVSCDCSGAGNASHSQLTQWPVQIKLAPVNAPFFQRAKLLIAADCTAYARADFHDRFMRNHVTLIGCPKLDMVDYAEKLTEILRRNDVRSLTVVRMEVPCCGGIEAAAKNALKASGKFIPWRVVTLSIDGKIRSDC